MSICTSCGNQNAYHTRSWYNDKLDRVDQMCNACGLDGPGDVVPDVYLPKIGMTFQAICDDMGNPIPVQSKQHKQQLMNERGIREHPDRLKDPKTWIEGSRDYRKKNFEQARPKIREAYRQYLNNAKRRGA